MRFPKGSSTTAALAAALAALGAIGCNQADPATPGPRVVPDAGGGATDSRPGADPDAGTSTGAGGPVDATASGADATPPRADALTPGAGGRGGAGGAAGADARPGTGGAGGAAGAGGAGGAAATQVRFAVIGDYGFDNADEAAVAKLVEGLKPDFVITTGDNNYSDGAAGTYEMYVGKYYHSFMGSYTGPSGAGSPTNRFWPAIGDHDWLSGSGPYTDYFTLPGNERYYDVDLGLVHLYSVDSAANEPDGWQSDGVQGKWLQARLAASRSCFDIVYFHHCPYSSGTHGSITYMRWPFAAWGAEAVMSGHDHDYERLQVDGISYFVNGSGGGGLRPFINVLPESKARYVDKHGAMLVTATTTGITYEFWTVDGERVDSFTAAKSCPK